MSERKILQVTATGGDKNSENVLTSPARFVSSIDDAIHQVIQDLRDTLWAFQVCVGLAAPQIGVDLRIAVLNWERESRDEDLVMINPELLSTSGKRDTKRESCMSVWGLQGEVERRTRALVRFLDEEGSPQEISFTGFGARVVQHEMDHLDGQLYRDRLRSGASLLKTDLFDRDSPA
jgi:peptide deformylase